MGPKILLNSNSFKNTKFGYIDFVYKFFLSQNVFFCQNFWRQKSLWPKRFWTWKFSLTHFFPNPNFFTNNLGLVFILSQKYSWIKNIFGSKSVLDLIFFCTQKYFGSRKFTGSKFLYTQKLFGTWHFFLTKFFWDQTFFWFLFLP